MSLSDDDPRSPKKSRPDLMLLARLNAHPRDSRIIFHEQEHFYEVDGERVPTSVSGIVHACFPSFNAQGVIDKYYAGWASGKQTRYYALIQYIRNVVGIEEDDLIKKEIARLWEGNGKISSSYGTAVHRLIELHLNDEAPPPDVDPSPTEFQQFLVWRAQHPTWTPWRTEWSIYHEEYKLAGQIDSVWKDTETGLYHMVDWKVIEDMKSTNEYGEMGYEPFQDMPNSKLHHYTVQQNLYKFILSEKYGMELASIRLVQMHKKLSGGAREWLLDNVCDRIKGLLDQRLTTPSPDDPGKSS